MNEAQLIKTIKAHIAKGEQHLVSAGLHLAKLKERCPDQAAFLALVKEEIGIGKSRTYELLQIADGRKTVEEVRADTADRQEKHRLSVSNGQSRDLAVVEDGSGDERRARQKEDGADFRSIVAAQKPAIDALAARLVSVDAALARGVLHTLTLRGPCGMVEMVLYEGAAALAFAIEDALAVRERPADDGLDIPEGLRRTAAA